MSSKKTTIAKPRPLTLDEKIGISVAIVIAILALAVGLAIALGLPSASSGSSSTSASSDSSGSGSSSTSASSSAIASGSASSSAIASGSASSSAPGGFAIENGSNYSFSLTALAAAMNTCNGCYSTGGTNCTNQGVVMDTDAQTAIQMTFISGSTYNMRIATGFVFAGNFLFAAVSGMGSLQMCTSSTDPGTSARFIITIDQSLTANSGIVFIQSASNNLYGRACTTVGCPAGLFGGTSPIAFDLTLGQAQANSFAQFLMVKV